MKKILFVTLAFASFIMGCKTGNQPTETIGKGKSDTIIAGSEKGSSDFLLLSPNEILDEIFAEKVTINAQWVNPRENVDKYIDTKTQALNLGVYVADFAYLNLNENKANAVEYFKIIKSLSQKLNMSGYFTKEFFNRIENNLANNDSIISISKEMYYNMSDILEQSNRQNIYAMVSCGALIETLYLTTLQVKDFKEYKRFAQKIFDQKQMFDNFYGYTSIYQSDPNVKAVLLQLETMKTILDGKPGSAPSKDKVSKDKKGHLVIGGGESYIVTKEDFENFKNNISTIRQSFISITKTK